MALKIESGNWLFYWIEPLFLSELNSEGVWDNPHLDGQYVYELTVTHKASKTAIQ